MTLQGERLRAVAGCLEAHTTEVDPREQPGEPVSDVVLVGVVDRHGARMFELTTPRAFAGNKGRFYRNDCLWDLLGEARIPPLRPPMSADPTPTGR